MTKLKALCISLSVDGYMAGRNQSIDTPVGVGGLAVFDWQSETRAGREMDGGEGGTEGVDHAFVRDSMDNSLYGAHIVGRNMFGPDRGEWEGDWKGWWGDNPAYHHDVFVLTHYEREQIVMEGGTTFYFVTDGIESALEQAKKSAGDRDVRLGGGPSTIRQYLNANLLDEIHIAQVPVLLGAGERLFEEPLPNINDWAVERIASDTVSHIRLIKT